MTTIVHKYPVVYKAPPPLDENEISRFNSYRKGQDERLSNGSEKYPKSSNRDYLDGWYNPVKLIPPFLSRDQYNKYLESINNTKE
jgi:hypothetical protein